jgi:hypothetical protein
VTGVSDRPLTPDLALAYLGELSTDIRAAAILDESGTLQAHSGIPEDAADDVAKLALGLFEQANESDSQTDQLEVTLPEGAVFALREHGWTLAIVAGRYALSSLMFYDLRMVARDLAGAPA